MRPDEAVGSAPLDFAAQRKNMVDSQVRTCDVTDPALLAAMYEVSRERFVAPTHVALAYADAALPAAGGRRRLLAPMVIARLIQAAALQPTDKVLDVAGGSGYGAALMARLAGKVVALEDEQAQTAAAAATLAAIGETRVETVTGALDRGFPAGSPYDAIVINGAIEELPQALAEQLREGGRLVAIDASFGAPKAVRFDRIAGELSRRPLFDAGAPVLPGFRKAPRFVF